MSAGLLAAPSHALSGSHTLLLCVCARVLLLCYSDGLTDPYIQYQYYARYGEAMGVFSANKTAVMELFLDVCLPLIKACREKTTLGWAACINA